MIDRDKPVRVFKNPRHGCYSIFQDGRLRASAREVLLEQVELRVRESGRQRMLKEQRRTLHAFALGKLLDWVHPDDVRRLERWAGRGLLYDPYRFDSFVDRETGSPVLFASRVRLDEEGVVYDLAA